MLSFFFSLLVFPELTGYFPRNPWGVGGVCVFLGFFVSFGGYRGEDKEQEGS